MTRKEPCEFEEIHPYSVIYLLYTLYLILYIIEDMSVCLSVCVCLLNRLLNHAYSVTKLCIKA